MTSHQSGMTSATRMRCADEPSRSTRARRCVVVAHAPLSAQPRVARATAVTRRHRKRLQNSRLRLPLSNDSRAASACRRERSGRTSTRFCRGRRDSVKHHLFLDPFTLLPTSYLCVTENLGIANIRIRATQSDTRRISDLDRFLGKHSIACDFLIQWRGMFDKSLLSCLILTCVGQENRIRASVGLLCRQLLPDGSNFGL